MRILEDAGCEAVQAGSGREGLALFDAGHFDAVFTDNRHAGMSGWEIARILREREPEIPRRITGWGETVSSSQKEEAA